MSKARGGAIMPAVAHMDAKALDLFQPYVTGKLPWDRGWAVAAAIDERLFR